MRVLSGNHLKLLAALTMLLDHMGVLLYPRIMIFRIIGRLSYPIFAFMIAESCRYTQNKLRYFLMIFGLGVGCQVVYYFVSGDTYLNILLTFSGSILLVYLLQAAHKADSLGKQALWSTLFAVMTLSVFGLCQVVHVDYGFWGIMIPVMVSFAHIRNFPHWAAVLLLGCGLVLLGTEYENMQQWALLSLPSLLILLLYSGKRGKTKMKNFFYIFYPVHLVVLQGIAWILR